MPLSSSQFGGGTVSAEQSSISTPMSLGTSTTGTFAQQTAWRTPRQGQMPVPYSKKTAGTTFNWDDTSSAPTVPQSDRGVGRNV